MPLTSTPSSPNKISAKTEPTELAATIKIIDEKINGNEGGSFLLLPRPKEKVNLPSDGFKLHKHSMKIINSLKVDILHKDGKVTAQHPGGLIA